MMPEMILYLLKVNIALILFYAGYHFILQRYTFHTLNRFYLLTGLLYSALYPLIDLSGILNRHNDLKQKIIVLTPDWQESMTYVINHAEYQDGNYWKIVLMIFWAGVVFMSIRLIIQLISLLRLHLQSSSFSSGKIKFRKISKAVNPFSFWRTIYVNPEFHEAAELRSILEHEQVHVKQLHTLDVLLAELSTIFYWFNPGVWLMRKAIKANLEFITDQQVIQSGIDSKEYQYALLKINIMPQNPLPVNNFHFLTIKKRIAMINKKPSGRITLGGYLLLLPAIMVIVLIVSTSKGSLKAETAREAISLIPQVSSPQTLSKLEKNFTIQEQQSSVKVDLLSTLNNFNSLIKETAKALDNASGADTNKRVSIRVKNSSQSPTQVIIGATPEKDTLRSGVDGPIYYINGVRSINGGGHLNPDSILTVNIISVH